MVVLVPTKYLAEYSCIYVLTMQCLGKSSDFHESRLLIADRTHLHVQKFPDIA